MNRLSIQFLKEIECVTILNLTLLEKRRGFLKFIRVSFHKPCAKTSLRERVIIVIAEADINLQAHTIGHTLLKLSTILQNKLISCLLDIISNENLTREGYSSTSSLKDESEP